MSEQISGRVRFLLPVDGVFCDTYERELACTDFSSSSVLLPSSTHSERKLACVGTDLSSSSVLHPHVLYQISVLDEPSVLCDTFREKARVCRTDQFGLGYSA